MQAAGVDRRTVRELRDRIRGERTQRQPPHHAAAEAAEHALQRVLTGDLVGPVGQEQQRGQVVDPAADVPQEVEGGAVGPVHVLDGQHGRPVRGGQLLEDGREHLPEVVRGEGVGERPAHVPDRVAQRAERTGRQQVVAGTGEHPPGPQGAREPAHEARLADTGLAGDEHDRSRSSGGALERSGEQAQLVVAFEQARRHDPIVPAQSPSTATWRDPDISDDPADRG